MPEFVYAFHGGKRFATKEEGTTHMANWQAWIAGMGDAVVHPGLFFAQSQTLSAQGASEGGGTNPLSGIVIVQAEDMAQALALAKPCPHTDIGGTIEVAQAMQM